MVFGKLIRDSVSDYGIYREGLVPEYARKGIVAGGLHLEIGEPEALMVEARKVIYKMRIL
jgi:hypothetical protein